MPTETTITEIEWVRSGSRTHRVTIERSDDGYPQSWNRRYENSILVGAWAGSPGFRGNRTVTTICQEVNLMASDPTTYQFFYIGYPFPPGFIKWKLDGKTTNLVDAGRLNDRQIAEVDALWSRVDALGNPALVYDAVREWNTGTPTVSTALPVGETSKNR